jgi:hypothetical protein
MPKEHRTGMLGYWNNGKTRSGTLDSRYLTLDKSGKRSAAKMPEETPYHENTKGGNHERRRGYIEN